MLWKEKWLTSEGVGKILPKLIVIVSLFYEVI